MAKKNDNLMIEETNVEKAPETPVTTVMSHTTDEIPELAGKAVGDTVTFTVRNVSDDGKTFDLEYIADVPVPEMEAPGAPMAGPSGRSQIAESLAVG